MRRSLISGKRCFWLPPLLLILAILTAFWLSAGITKPLSVMGRAMKHVQRGEFNQALHVMPKVGEGHSEVAM